MGSIWSEIPAFTWNVVLHWQALITGGLVTALVAIYQGVTKSQLRTKTFVLVFIIAEFISSCFLAWNDEHKNTQTVITEKAAISSTATKCFADLSSTQAVLHGKEELAGSLQTSLNSLQAPQLQQQATINSCVVSLGKMNPVVRREIRVIQILFGATEPKTGRYVSQFAASKVFASEFVITTNEDQVRAAGFLRCEQDFTIMGTPELPPIAMMAMISTGLPTKISDHEYRISITNSGSYWGPSSPMYMPISSKTQNLTGCAFVPQ